MIKDIVDCCDDKDLGNTDPPINKKDSVVIERSRIEGEDHDESLHIKRTISYKIDNPAPQKENK
ncbi:MAG: hypothetical protein H6621_13310 [Halobacteriovoraceae bacterium]|nr:hypothetical protein [Halobacteriovoraceae bacterium]